MHDFIKYAVKDMLPPAILRMLRHDDTPSDAWGPVKYGLDGLRLPGGRRFSYRHSDEDRRVCRDIFFRRSYATEHLSRAKEIVEFYESHPDPIIVDAGANIGAASVWF